MSSYEEALPCRLINEEEVVDSVCNQENLNLEGINTKSITQLLGALDNLVEEHQHHHSGSHSEILEKLLKHMERLDVNFHRHDIVRYMYYKIDQTMKSEIVLMLEQGKDDVNVLASSSNYGNLESEFLHQLDSVIQQILNSNYDMHRTPSHLSSEDSSVCGSEVSWGNFMVDNNTHHSTPTGRRIAAKNLNIRNSVDVRLKGIEDLQQMFAGDIVANEHWEYVLDSISNALNDPDVRIVTKCLDLLRTLFKVSPPEVTGEIYLSIISHLIQLFQSLNPTYYEATEEDPLFRIMLKKFRLVSYLMYELPKHWIQYQDSLLVRIFSLTFKLFTLSMPDNLRTRETTRLGPYEYLTLVDQNCRWFTAWTKDSCARKHIGATLKSSELFDILISLLSNSIRHKSIEFGYDIQKIMSLYSHSDRKNLKQHQFNITDRLQYLILVHSILVVGKVSAYRETTKVCEKKQGDVLWLAVFCLMDMFQDNIEGTCCFKRLASVITTVLLENLMKKPNIDIIRALLFPLKALYSLLKEKVVRAESLNNYTGIRKAMKVVSNVFSELLKDKSMVTYIVDNSTLAFSGLPADVDIIAELLYFFQHLFSNSKDKIISDQLRHELEHIFVSLIEHVTLAHHISILESIASLLVETKDNKHILVHFVRHSQGHRILRNLGAFQACAESLVEIYTLGNFTPSTCYLISQFSIIPEILEVFVKRDIINILLDRAYEKAIQYDWIPEIEFADRTYDNHPDEVDLLLLLLSSPILIPVIYAHSKQILDRVFQTLVEECMASCQEMEQHHHISCTLRILFHLANQLDNMVLLEEYYSILYLLSKKSIVDAPKILDENYLLHNIILSRIRLFRENTEGIALDDLKYCIDSSYELSAMEVAFARNYVSNSVVNHSMHDISDSTTKRELQNIILSLTSNNTRSINNLRTIRNVIHYSLQKLNNRESSFSLPIGRTFVNMMCMEIRAKQLEIGSLMIAHYAKNCGIVPHTELAVFKTNLVSLNREVPKIFLKTGDGEELGECVTKQSIHSDSNLYNGYDWFIAVIFLLFEGDKEQTLSIISEFAKIPELYFMWFKLGSTTVRTGVNPICILSQAVEFVLRRQYPMAYNSLYMRGISLHVVVHRWLQQFFLNYLNFFDIAALIAILTTHGIDYLVYFCAVLINCLSHKTREQAAHYQDYSQESWNYEFSCPIVDFSIGDFEIQTMKNLEVIYKNDITNMLGAK